MRIKPILFSATLLLHGLCFAGQEAANLIVHEGLCAEVLGSDGEAFVAATNLNWKTEYNVGGGDYSGVEGMRLWLEPFKSELGAIFRKINQENKRSLDENKLKAKGGPLSEIEVRNLLLTGRNFLEIGPYRSPQLTAEVLPEGSTITYWDLDLPALRELKKAAGTYAFQIDLNRWVKHSPAAGRFIGLNMQHLRTLKLEAFKRTLELNQISRAYFNEAVTIAEKFLDENRINLKYDGIFVISVLNYVNYETVMYMAASLLNSSRYNHTSPLVLFNTFGGLFPPGHWQLQSDLGPKSPADLWRALTENEIEVTDFKQVSEIDLRQRSPVLSFSSSDMSPRMGYLFLGIKRDQGISSRRR